MARRLRRTPSAEGIPRGRWALLTHVRATPAIVRRSSADAGSGGAQVLRLTDNDLRRALAAYGGQLERLADGSTANRDRRGDSGAARRAPRGRGRAARAPAPR